MMKTIFITGGNRGLGLGIVKHLVSNSPSPEFIFASYHDPKNSQELFDLAKQYPNVIIPIKLDINDDQSVNHAKTEVENRLGKNRGLNCLINNAAVSKALQLSNITEEDMLDTYRQNVIGPWRTTNIFLPLIEKAVTNERNVLQASIINISATMGSATLAPTMPFFPYDYQCSKAALNIYTVCFATEYAKSNIFIALLHPGWVKTDMGGDDAPLSIEEACKLIVECITSMKDEHYAKLIDGTTGSKCAVVPF